MAEEKFYSGRDGKLFLDRSATAGEPTTGLVEQLKVRDWTLQTNLSLLEITALGDNHRDYVPSVVGYTGSATLLYYRGSNNQVQASNWLRDAGMRTSTNGVTTDEKIELQLKLQDGGSQRAIQFKAYITSASIGVTVGDVVSTQFSFTVCGKPSSSNI